MDLMAEKAFECDEGQAVVFQVIHRPSVASRLWWSVQWREDGAEICAAAQDWELCLWRAIQKHKNLQRQRELERYASEGPARWSVARVEGWEYGDGI
jgi:hypothetical protein